MESLKQILSDGNTVALAKFVDKSRVSHGPEPGQVCTWCHIRIAPLEGATAGKRQSRPEGMPLPRLCQVCQRWYCVEHCNFRAEIAAGARSRRLELTCCQQCSTSIDVIVWKQEMPPSGL